MCVYNPNITRLHFVVVIVSMCYPFRMCSYKRDYLKEASPESGSKKLLYWSSKDIADWIRNIELDEYVGGLEEAGIHGAFMVSLLASPYKLDMVTCCQLMFSNML